MLFSASWYATLQRREGLVTRPLILLHVPLLRASPTKKASKVPSTDTIHIISVPSQTIYIQWLCEGMLHAMGRSLGRKTSSHYARPSGCLARGGDPLPSCPCNLVVPDTLYWACWMGCCPWSGWARALPLLEVGDTVIHHHALISFNYIKSQKGLFLSLYHGYSILANQIAA